MTAQPLPPPAAEAKVGRGVLIGFATAIVLAIGYAVFITTTEHTWGWVLLIIGILTGVIALKAAGAANVTVGVCAAIATVVGIILGIIGGYAGLFSKVFDVSFFDVLKDLDYVEVVKDYFETSPVSYAYAAGGVVLAFVIAAGLLGKKAGK